MLWEYIVEGLGVMDYFLEVIFEFRFEGRVGVNGWSRGGEEYFRIFEVEWMGFVGVVRRKGRGFIFFFYFWRG